MGKILVIEDEPRVAAAIKRTLEAGGNQVKVANDSDLGMKLVLKNEHDLIILDRILPGSYDGVEIAARARSGRVDTPILMLTALGEVRDRVAGLNAGSDDYLIKPFSMKELEARVRSLLRRPQRRIDTILKIDDLELNSITHEVARAGKTISLSKREYKLLYYLMYNKNQIISKEQILNHVWDMDAVILPNTIEVYIGYLRKKIDRLQCSSG